MSPLRLPAVLLTLGLCSTLLPAQHIATGPCSQRIKKALDAVGAVDTHSHLRPYFAMHMGATHMVSKGVRKNCALRRILRGSYYSWIHPVTPWPKDGEVATWWQSMGRSLADARATSSYRVLLPAFADLYGADLEKLDLAEVIDLNRRIEEHNGTEKWVSHVIKDRARIDLMLVDPCCTHLDFRTHYPFTVHVLNINDLIHGYHPSGSRHKSRDPFEFARKFGMPMKSLDDYLAVIDRLLQKAKEGGAVCLKCSLAYQRGLDFNWTSKEVAAKVFGRPRKELKHTEIKAFQDFIMWQVAAKAAAHDLPLQIHTGHARIAGSNPMALVPLISGNRKTKFILFHGGFPWVGEVGVIALRYRNVWLDSVWLPTLSPTMARRAFQEWFDQLPASRIMWGSDMWHAEGTYGATVLTRRVLAEALAAKVVLEGLSEPDAIRIGRQVLRDNALDLFPSLRKRLPR